MNFKARVRLKAVQMMSFKAIQTNFRAVWTCFSRVVRMQKKWTALNTCQPIGLLYLELKIITALANNVHEKKIIHKKI